MLRLCSGAARAFGLAAVLGAGCIPDPDIQVPDFTIPAGFDGGTPAPDGATAAGWQAGRSGVTAHLRGVWVADAMLSTIYAVGHEGTILRGTGASSFTAETSGTTENLYAVLGISADEAYAVGNNGVILHRLNGKWGAEAGELMLKSAIFALAAPAPGEIYAVGDRGTIVHRSGGTWKIEAGPAMTELRAVAGKGADEVYAAGAGGAIWRRTNGAWAADPAVPAERGNLFGLAVVDGTVFAAGEFALVLRRETDKWTAEPTVKPMPMMGRPAHLFGIYGSSGEVFVVGEGGAAQRRAGAQGMATWTEERSGVTMDLSAIGGAGPRALVAVGSGGAVVRRQ